jgi:hypothetical protein
LLNHCSDPGTGIATVLYVINEGICIEKVRLMQKSG